MRRSVAIAAWLALLCGCSAEKNAADSISASSIESNRISRPFEYSGYSTPAYPEQQRVAVHVPMSDGTLLAATIFLPAGGPEAKFPVLLWYLPGHRESIDPATGELQPYGSAEQIRFFTSHGYAWVIAEMRGSGASFGTRVDRGPQIGLDGKDLVDWLAAQSWSNGAVGMVGLSYQGFSQYATAAQRPKALKAIFPEIAGFDEYSVMFYPGGIQNIAMSALATTSIARDDQNHYLPGTSAAGETRRAVLPSAPVVDEDGDGELVDEIPIDKDGDGSFLNDGPPTYRDGNQREDVYYRATREHLGNVNLTAELISKAPWRDSTLANTDLTYADLGPGDKPVSIAGAGIAVYNRAGWFDYHARCATQWFATLQGRTPTRLMFAPTAHSGFAGGRSSGGPYWSMFDVQLTEHDLNIEKLRFFDRWLKGVDNGIDREAPVYIYVMGGGWRAENEWPLARAVSTRYYFASDHTLRTDAAVGGADQFRVDFTADSRTQGANRWNFRLAFSKTPMQGVDGGLAYETAPLASDVEVTGHPLVQLAASSTARDGDFFVYLEDVNPNGETLMVSDGRLRASFEKNVSIARMVTADKPFAVKPALPWPGFNRADQNPDVFADGRIASLTIDLMPTAWVFKKGHRIRVSITGADWPTFQLHPQLSPANKPADKANITPTITVHRTADHVSFIELPVIP